MLPDLHLQTRPEEGKRGQLQVELQIFSGREHGQMPETGFSANAEDPFSSGRFSCILYAPNLPFQLQRIELFPTKPIGNQLDPIFQNEKY